jgi:Luciferase-like monooxygenase
MRYKHCLPAATPGRSPERGLVTVKLAVRQPTDRSRIILAFSTGAGRESFARATEAAGFSGVYEADRPLPSRKWTAGCGHRDFDPLVTLSYVAGATERPLLQTKMYVLAYRNPFLAAKRSHRWTGSPATACCCGSAPGISRQSSPPSVSSTAHAAPRPVARSGSSGRRRAACSGTASTSSAGLDRTGRPRQLLSRCRDTCASG